MSDKGDVSVSQVNAHSSLDADHGTVLHQNNKKNITTH